LNRLLHPALVLLMAAGIVIYAGSTRWIRVNSQIIEFEDLPKHLDGLRVLHFSDLHSNHPARMNIDIWPIIRSLDFDVAFITGDIVRVRDRTSRIMVDELNPHRNDLAQLAEGVPTFFVEGNHESHSFAQISQFMNDVGIKMLYNQRYTLNINGGELDIIGTKDFYTMRRLGWDGFYELFSAGSSNFQIVLTHQPQMFDRIKNSGIDLVFAGHTHGGQIRLPFLPTIFAPNQGFFPAYGNGLYRYNDAQMFVSRGIGTTYFPIRFFNRPEIGLFELRRGG